MEITVIGETAPIARWILRHLRDKNVGVESFREWMKRAGIVLASHMSREIEWREVTVTTPLEVEAVEYEPVEKPLLVGILGASIPLLEGFETVYPGAPVGLVAARRIEEGEKLEIKVYYERLPAKHVGTAILVDPMLATGYTIAAVADLLAKRGVKRIVVGTVIASRAGLSYLQARGGIDAVYTLAVDPELNDKYFIVPGLGDAGDRSLGVVPG